MQTRSITSDAQLEIEVAERLVFSRRDAAGVVTEFASIETDGTGRGLLGGSLSPVFNVKTLYGARGDGSTDDSAAIQAAVDAAYAATRGGTVYFPPGDYVLGTGLTTPQNAQKAVSLWGAGKGGTGVYPTRLIRTGSIALLTATGTGVDAGHQHNGLSVRHMTLHGNGQTGKLVNLSRCASATFEQVRFTGADDYALYAEQLWNTLFIGCNWESSGDLTNTIPAVKLTDAANDAAANTNTVQFVGCIWEGNAYTDIELAGQFNPSAGVVITNGKWERSGGYAVDATNVSQCAVVGGYMFVNGSKPAVRHFGGTRISFIGLEIADVSPATASWLIQLQSGDHARVIGCSFRGGGSGHVRLDSGYGQATVLGNSHTVVAGELEVSDARTTKTGIIATSGQIVNDSREQVARTAQGIISETFDRKSSATSTLLPTSGDMRGAIVGLKQGDVVSKVYVTVTGAGSSVTHAQAALYDKSGNLLASSADSTADRTAFQSAGVVTLTFSSAYTVPTTDGYYLVVTLSASTTVPTLLRASSQAGAINAFGSGAIPTVVQTGQATVPSTATFAASNSTIHLACG